MKIGWVLIVALAVLGIGASTAQAQCCGDMGYTTYYAAPAYSSCCSGYFTGYSAPSYYSYYSGYSPYYSSYYAPYYSGWGWGGRAWRTGYWGSGGGCCGW